MNFQEKQQEYARLIVENGAAIQKGQELVLRCPAECWEFGRMIVKAGYEAGAKEVIVHWGDDEVARLRYEYAPMEVFENVPKWRADSMNSYAENGAAFIAITAENPNAFKAWTGKNRWQLQKRMTRRWSHITNGWCQARCSG